MKYIKITGKDFIMGCDTLTQDDLGRLKSGSYDAIINRITEEYFDPEDNQWKKIESTGV